MLVHLTPPNLYVPFSCQTNHIVVLSTVKLGEPTMIWIYWMLNVHQWPRCERREEMGPGERASVHGGCPWKAGLESRFVRKAQPGPSSRTASWLATGAFLCACVTAASHHPHQMPNQWDHLILELSLQNRDKANCLRYSTVGHTQQLREKKKTSHQHQEHFPSLRPLKTGLTLPSLEWYWAFGGPFRCCGFKYRTPKMP